MHHAINLQSNATNENNFKVNLGHFGCTTADEKAEILKDRNAKNTNKSTKSSMNILYEYIKAKNLPPLDATPDKDLPKLFEDFYSDARTKGTELYKTASMKTHCSNINRWFKENRKIDIIADT